MNQLSKICVCRSVSRKNPFARWSLKPISSSSLVSNNSTSLNLKTLISKFHHTFSYPPQTFSTPAGGEPAAVSEDPAVAERNSDDNQEDEISEDDFDLDYAIHEIIEETGEARDHIDLGTIPPLEAIKPPLELFKALLEKLGLDEGNVYEDGDYPPHLESYRRRLSLMKASVEDTVA
ncbi:hypothetical protein MKW94_014100, partial [Papaver nudicaule]|nr:hypothetical protein [Papaver nudicaule]